MKIRFNKAQLPKPVLDLLRNKTNVYAQTEALSKLVEDLPSPDINVLLCLANLELACAKSTEFEEDLIDSGNLAIELLNRALAIEPDNEDIKKDILTIQKNIRKAEKAAHQILKHEKENPVEIHIAYLNELAFYYFSRNTKSPEYAAKGHRYYQLLYEKQLEDNPESQSLLYYWHALTLCKFILEGYDSTKQEIEQLIHWDLKPQHMIDIDYVTNGYWMKLFHYAQSNDLHHFKLLYEEWYAKMVLPEQNRKPYLALHFNILNTISDWLLKQNDTETYLNYILENAYLFFDKRILTTEETAIITRIKGRIK